MTDLPPLPDLSALHEHVRTNPKLALSYLDLGKALAAHDRPIAALRSYQHAVTLRPNYAEAQFRLGQEWWQQGDIEAARSHFEQAASVRQPGLSLALHFNRDLVYGHHGMREPWLLWDGNRYRLYYLAGRWDEPSRSIHTAHSPDLVTWHYDRTILIATDTTSFGCGTTRIVNGLYRLYYSVRQQTDAGVRETIALATSTDGLDWEFHDTDAIVPDPQHYAPHRWRNPTSLLDPVTRKTYFVLGAIAAGKAADYRGCVAVAVGDLDSNKLTVLPPLVLQRTQVGDASAFGQIDRPQIVGANGRYYLTFSCPSDRLHPQWRSRQTPRRLSRSSMFCYVADSILGPYHPFPEDEPFIWGSERTQLARSAIFFKQAEQKLFLYGHNPRSQLLEITDRYPVVWDGKRIGLHFPVSAVETKA